VVRPLLFVDIDGVLNPYDGPCPEGFVEHDLFGDEPVRVCAEHGRWLRELAERYDLAWGSSWSEADRAVLGRVLELPAFVGAVVLPSGEFDPALKVPAIELFAAGRALAWIDDLFGPSAWDWAAARGTPTLLIPIDPAAGLTRPSVDQLLAWSP
jgi:hypothetical protein